MFILYFFLLTPYRLNHYFLIHLCCSRKSSLLHLPRANHSVLTILMQIVVKKKNQHFHCDHREKNGNMVAFHCITRAPGIQTTHPPFTRSYPRDRRLCKLHFNSCHFMSLNKCKSRFNVWLILHSLCVYYLLLAWLRIQNICLWSRVPLLVLLLLYLRVGFGRFHVLSLLSTDLHALGSHLQ